MGGGKKERMLSAVNKNLSNVLAAGFISAATIMPLPGIAVAADGLVTGTPLESKLAAFGAASYPVFNSITDVSPLADKFLDLVDKKVKAPDAAELAQKGVDGLLAIPDSANSAVPIKDGNICLPGSAAASSLRVSKRRAFGPAGRRWSRWCPRPRVSFPRMLKPSR